MRESGVARRALPWTARLAVSGALVVVAIVATGVMAGGSDDTEPVVSESSWSSVAGFVPIRPVRILDTRSALGLTGPFRSPEPRTLKVTGSVPAAGGPRVAVPTGATAVVLNVTVVLPTHQGFLSVRPGDDRTAVQTSNLNFWRGAVIPNAVLVALAADGTLQITYDAYGIRGHQTDVLVDVMGYFGGAGSPGGGSTTTTTSVSGSTTPSTTIAVDDLEEVLTVSVRTGNEAQLLHGPSGLSVVTHSPGVFHLVYPREMDRCLFMATHRVLSPGASQSGTLSVEVSEPKTKVIVRVFNALGVVTNGTDNDGFDLIAFCPG